MRGHGPLILECVSKTQPMTAKEILAEAVQKSICRAPGLTTVYTHLGVLVAMGCLQKEGATYVRLVDSEFDVLEASEVAA